MPRAFHFSPFYGIDGSILVNDRGEIASESDMARFFRMAEPELDRLTLEMCAHERAQGNKLEPWQLEAELQVFARQLKRGTAA